MVMACEPMPVLSLLAGFLVDVYQDYKYLFIMCGSVILTGGVFLLSMNVYNHYKLRNEGAAEDPEQKPKDSENPEQLDKQTSKNTTEHAEPKAEMDTGVQKSSD